MIAPLTIKYWEALRRLAEPLELMKFTLIYDDDLPASANSSKKQPTVAAIRNRFHDQIADLWDRHIILRELVRTARYPKLITHQEEAIKRDEASELDFTKAEWARWNTPDPLEPIPPLQPFQIDLCAPIKSGTAVAYRPIIRKSLGLACALDITFLRQEDPGSLVLQGGDIDGRMKTLFDALRMPSPQEEEAAGITPTNDPLDVLMESDTLISDLAIKTGRLLGARARKVHAVHLTIDVTVKVLRVASWNQCLMGD